MGRHTIAYMIVASGLCAALAGLAVCVLGAPLGAFSPYLDILGQFAPQAGFGAAGIAVLYALMRLRVMAALALATALISLIVVWPRATIAACTPAQPVHRIVFLNLWNGNRTIDETMAYLATLNADAIVLVEMRPGFKLALNTLVNRYVYQTACPGHCTALILSQAPIRETTAQLTRPSGPRSLAAVELAFDDGVLNLVGVHLYRPWPFNAPHLQEDEARILSQVVKPLSEPRLVLGDFNAVPWGAIVQGVEKDAGLTALEGRGTWRANLPALLRIPIDQALAGPGIACATKKVGRRVGSDHRPVIVDFAFAR